MAFSNNYFVGSACGLLNNGEATFTRRGLATPTTLPFHLIQSNLTGLDPSKIYVRPQWPGRWQPNSNSPKSIDLLLLSPSDPSIPYAHNSTYVSRLMLTCCRYGEYLIAQKAERRLASYPTHPKSSWRTSPLPGGRRSAAAPHGSVCSRSDDLVFSCCLLSI